MPSRAAIWPSGTRVTWRGLTWGEYREVQAHQGPPAEKALEVYQKCLIEGPRPNEIPAGIMMWVYNYELENSPFSGSFQSLSLPLEKARAKVSGTYLLSAQAFIAAVFKLPFAEMDKWDAETFLTRLAQAEFVSGAPLNPVDPQAQPAQKAPARPKKPLTDGQKIALERRQNDRPNPKGTATSPRRS